MAAVASPVFATVGDAKGGDPWESKEIDAIWKQVQDRVIQLAGGDPKKVQRSLDIEGVLLFVEQAQDSKKKKSERYGWVKDTFRKTLQVIQTVGGIVADGASHVFEPAQTCYNALTFVIQAWQGYEGIFENLAELLERCVEFLDRLDYYVKGKMDLKLTRVACQHLQLFVEICDRSIRLRKKHVKLLAFTKQLFLNDSSIKDLLALMERLVDKERNLVVAQMFKFVSDNTGDLKTLVEDRERQRKDDDAKKWKQSIVKSLGFDQSELDRDKEPVPSWRKTLDSYRNQLIPETGKWLSLDDRFVTWAKGTTEGNCILVLQGDGRSGKSMLMANALKYLGKMDGVAARAAFAYFFLESDSKKAELREDLFERVSRSLLWQCSTGSEALTKSMAAICEKAKFEFEGVLDKWNQLFVDNKDRLKTDTIFYVLIDGLNEDIQPLFPLLERLNTNSGDRRIRVLITAEPDAVEVLASAPEITFDSISIRNHNDSDIADYITYRMNQMPMLSDLTRSGIPEWRDTILNTLRDKCEGDYFKLVNSLDTIAKLDLIEDINDVLDNADKDRSDQILAELDRLNRERTPKEIMEINEIALWITTPSHWLTTEEMEAVLALKHNNGSSIAPTLSLLSFEDKIKRKYHIFQINNRGWVDFRTPELSSLIPVKDTSMRDETSSSGFKEIQESEVNIVKHFLHTVCPPDLYQRFEFDKFFDARLGARFKNFICQDPENANIRVAILSLKVLTEDRNARTQPLIGYAGANLLLHLQNSDLAVVDRSYKMQIGPLLVRLFREINGIDSIFWLEDEKRSTKIWRSGEHIWLRGLRVSWLYSYDGVNELLKWFKDSAVVKGIEDEEDKEFVAAFTAPGANLHEVLLTPAAKHIVSHLLQRDGFSMPEVWTVIFFLNGLMAKLHPDLYPDVPRSGEDILNLDADDMDKIEKWMITLAELNRIEEWALKQLGEDSRDSLWEVQMAYTTEDMCEDVERHEISNQRSRKALEMDPNNFLASYYVASEAQDNQEAIDLLTNSIVKLDEHIEEDPTWLDDENSHQALATFMELELGNRLWDAGEFDKAVARHRRSFKYNSTRFSRYLAPLQRYRDKEAWDNVVAFVELINSGNTDWKPFFDDLINTLIFVVEFNDLIAAAAKSTSRWDMVETLFTQAIDVAVQKEDIDNQFYLHQQFGATLNRDNAKNEDKTIELWETGLGIARKNSSNTDITPRDMFQISDVLTRLYLRRAFRADVLLTPSGGREYGVKMAALVQDTEASENITVSACLARFHYKREEASDALKAVADVMKSVLELLSDNDPSNDDHALYLLAKVVNTFEDKANLFAVWELRNYIQIDDIKKYDDWVEEQAAQQKAQDEEDKADQDGDEGEGDAAADNVAKTQAGDDEDAEDNKSVRDETTQTATDVRNETTQTEEDGAEANGNKVDENTAEHETTAKANSTDTSIPENGKIVNGENAEHIKEPEGAEVDKAETDEIKADDNQAELDETTDEKSQDGATEEGTNPETEDRDDEDGDGEDGDGEDGDGEDGDGEDGDGEDDDNPTSDHEGDDSEGEGGEGESEDGSSASQPPPPPKPISLVICDGCGEEYLYSSEHYHCADCAGLTVFDEKCYQLLMHDELKEPRTKGLLCDKTHKFIFFPKWTPEEKAGLVPAGSIPFEGDILTIEDWKKQLKAKYYADGELAPAEVDAAAA